MTVAQARFLSEVKLQFGDAAQIEALSIIALANELGLLRRRCLDDRSIPHTAMASMNKQELSRELHRLRRLARQCEEAN